MTEADYHHARQLFSDAGFKIGRSEYHWKHFGCWWIEVEREGGPPRRVLWDGRDRWLIVELHEGDEAWLVRWIGRKADDQSPEIALARLERPFTDKEERKIQERREAMQRKMEARLRNARTSSLGSWLRSLFS